VGVRSADPNFSTAYPGGQFEGRAAVVTTLAPDAVTVVTTSPVPTLVAPYTIRRWVTWTNSSGGSPLESTCTSTIPACFKRLDVRIEWADRAVAKSVRYTSVYYPGNQGPAAPSAGSLPAVDFTISGGVCRLPVTPQAVAAVSCTPTGSESVTTFTFVSTATDPNGLPLTYNWNFGDCDVNPANCQVVGSSGVSTVTHQFVDQGGYTVVLGVANNAVPQGSAIASHGLLIGNAKPNPPQLPAVQVNGTPVARFTHTYSTVPSPPAVSPLPNAPLLVSVDATESTDPDVDAESAPEDDPNGDPLIYTWDWGDGTPAGNGPSPSHTYASGGTFELRLTVTDPGGLTNTTTLACRPTLCADTILTNGSLIVIGGLNCAINAPGAAFFKNPTDNVTSNFINIKGNGEVKNLPIFYEVKTNAACTGVTVEIPKNPGTLTGTLVQATIVSGVKTWRLTTTIPDGTKFNSGSQSASVRATGSGANPTQVLNFSAS
jgi:PKD repeat protein